MRILRFREVKHFTQGHTAIRCALAGEGQVGIENPVFPDSRACALSPHKQAATLLIIRISPRCCEIGYVSLIEYSWMLNPGRKVCIVLYYLHYSLSEYVLFIAND